MDNKENTEIQSNGFFNIVKIILSSSFKVLADVLATCFIGLPFLAYYALNHIFSYLGYSENQSDYYSISTLIVIVVAAILIVSVKHAIDESNEKILKHLKVKERELASLHDCKVKELETINFQFRNDMDRREITLRNLQKQYDEKVENFNSIVNEKSQTYPWLATLFSELKYIEDEKISHHFKHKPHPAIKAAEEISRIAKEKRALQKLNKMYEYQLNYYENLFPWLEDFKELDPVSAYKIVNELETDMSSEYESVREWLSPEDYKNLPSSEKWQLALQRYLSKQKTNWEVGIDYERYIGYIYENKGYLVKYQGALLGLEDMGRDLQATSNKETVIIQCKRWSASKTIHEKHIFQLYGSLVQLRIERNDNSIRGIFITSASLSPVAKNAQTI